MTHSMTDAIGRLMLDFIDHGRTNVPYDIWADVEHELCEFLRERSSVGCSERIAATALLAQLDDITTPAIEHCH